MPALATETTRLICQRIFGILTAFIIGTSAAHADTTQMVRDGVKICFEHASNIRKSKDDLVAIGWESQGIYEDLRIFFNKRRDGVAAIGSASFGGNACGFGVKEMSAKQSAALAEKLAKSLMGAKVQRLTDAEISEMGASAGWVGVNDSNTAAIIVAPEVNYPRFYRGAMIYVVFVK